MKVALVHDWLTGMRGGERMLERLCGLFPGAPIFTLVWKHGSVSPSIETHPIRTSFLQALPGAVGRYRWLLPLFPRAVAGFDLRGFDAVVSSSHAVAKGAPVPEGTFHLSYVHTPMRYVWELQDQYFPPGRFGWPLDAYVRWECARLRRWDVATSGGPHALVTNSAHVAGRIRRHYQREAEVIYGPVDLARFTPAEGPGDHYLLAGAMAPNKRGDLALQACARLGRPLVVVGSGQESGRLRRVAGPDARFLGWVRDEEMPALYRGARALLFPGEEDLGLVPIEAMASGRPVVALGRGGAVETVGRGADPGALARVAAGGAEVVPGGVLFGTQTVEGLCDALRLLERTRFDPRALAERARPFSAEAFDARFMAAFDRAYAEWRAARPAPSARGTARRSAGRSP